MKEYVCWTCAHCIEEECFSRFGGESILSPPGTAECEEGMESFMENEEGCYRYEEREDYYEG